MTPSDLLKINVNEHTEKKQNLTYLSWAWAWAEALKLDPTANFEVKTFHHDQYTELPYMNVNGTGMVWVTVTLLGTARTCMLPVMDHRNKAIPNPDSFQVNTAIMRCMTKALSLHGLGLYIYAGEDLPEGEEPEPKKKEEPKNKKSDADLQLVTDGIIEYTNPCSTVEGLNSYWKANQQQLDDLKVQSPERYAQVIKRFSELKKQFMEQA
jgi:hypothetical protein